MCLNRMKEQTVQNLGSMLLLLLTVIALNADSNVTLTMKAPERSLFIGEPFELEVGLKRCGTAQNVMPVFVEPQMQHLWIKRADKVLHSKEDACTLSTKRYRLSAQQEGLLQISPAEVQVAYDQVEHDAWGNRREKRHWQSYYSNAVEIHVAPLPEETTLVGEFTLAFNVENSEVAAGKPLHGEIVVEGEGNFEDLSLRLPVARNANIFADEPKLAETGSGNRESWRQKLTFTGDSDFTIEPISLRYFDPTEGSVKALKTAAVTIEVVGGNDALQMQDRDAETLDENEDHVVVYAATSALLGVLLLLFLLRSGLGQKQKKVKVSHRHHKAVLRLLLAHREDEGVPPVIEALEAHIYGGQKLSIDQKELKKVLERYR